MTHFIQHSPKGTSLNDTTSLEPNVQTHEPMVCMGGGALYIQITILTVPLLPKSSRGWRPSFQYKPLGSDLNLGRCEFWLHLWLVSSAEQCIALQVMLVNCFSIDHILALLALHFPSSPSILELLSWQISVHQDYRLLTWSNFIFQWNCLSLLTFD